MGLFARSSRRHGSSRMSFDSRWTTRFYDDLEEALILADVGMDTAGRRRGAAAQKRA